MRHTIFAALVVAILLGACAPSAPAATKQPAAAPTASPPTPTAEPAIYLSELTPLFTEAAGGNFCIGREPVGDPVKCTGPVLNRDWRKYPNSIFAHANSNVEYDLRGEYTRLRFSPLLLGPDCGDGAVFTVYLDGEQLYRSPTIKRQTTPRQVELDVTGGYSLRLSVDQLGNLECDWSTWGEPQLVLSEQLSQAPQPTPTPSGPVEPPVNAYQPLPGPRLPITAENIANLEPLAYIGEGTMMDIATLPDPNRVAVVYSTGIQVIDLTTHQVVAEYPLSLAPPTQRTYIHSFSPDGGFFLYTRPAETIILNLSDGVEQRLDYQAVSFTFSPDGTYALLSSDKNAHLVTLATGDVHEFPYQVAASNFSEDGQHLAVAGNWAATVYTLPDLQQNGSITSSRSIQDVKLLSNGVLLFITERNMRTYVFPGLQQLHDVSDPSGFLGYLGDTQLSEDESLLLTRSRTDTSQFRVWDMASLNPVATMKEQRRVALAPDNLTAISHGQDGVVLWDLQTDSRLLTIPSNSFYEFQYSQNGDYVAAIGVPIFVINTRTLAVEELHAARVLSATPSGLIYLQPGSLLIRNFSGVERNAGGAGFDGRVLYSADVVATWGNSSTITLHDIQSGEFAGQLPMRASLSTILKDPDSLPGWDIGLELKSTLNPPSLSGPVNPGELTYRIDDNRVLFYEQKIGGFDEDAPLFELLIPEYMRNRVTKEIYVKKTQIDPINNLFYLAVTSGERQVMVRVYNLETHSMVREYLYFYTTMKELDGVYYYCDYASFTLSQDYTRLALIDEKCNIQVVDTSNWRTLYSVDAGARGSNPFVAFSPDGRLLVTIFGGDKVNIWNAENGDLLQSLQPLGGYPDYEPPYVGFTFLEDAFMISHGGQYRLSEGDQYSIWGVLQDE